ncbi:hypothetical protein EVAR_9012_1 [Eumeta japonica]|uniref:Uncharacterized protein n=1 Tax=Eumeta variegata TaxID=151549 RepID=A0A4C1TVZ5_EUMVA|nr:hypothetical protein EVAR_9012_1 [Eumeta japonica]
MSTLCVPDREGRTDGEVFDRHDSAPARRRLRFIFEKRSGKEGNLENVQTGDGEQARCGAAASHETYYYEMFQFKFKHKIWEAALLRAHRISPLLVPNVTASIISVANSIVQRMKHWRCEVSHERVAVGEREGEDRGLLHLCTASFADKSERHSSVRFIVSKLHYCKLQWSGHKSKHVIPK